MAATKVTGGRAQNIVELTAIDADWDDGCYRPLSSIQFNPGSDGTDVLVVKDGSDSGVVLMEVTADAANNESVKYFDKIPFHVYIDYSDCTLSSGHKVILIYAEDWNG